MGFCEYEVFYASYFCLISNVVRGLKTTTNIFGTQTQGSDLNCLLSAAYVPSLAFASDHHNVGCQGIIKRLLVDLNFVLECEEIHLSLQEVLLTRFFPLFVILEVAEVQVVVVYGVNR